MASHFDKIVDTIKKILEFDTYSDIMSIDMYIFSLCQGLQIVYRGNGKYSTCSSRKSHTILFLVSVIVLFIHLLQCVMWFMSNYLFRDPSKPELQVWELAMMVYFTSVFCFINVNQLACFSRQTEGKATGEAAFQMEDLAREYGARNYVRKTPLMVAIVLGCTVITMPFIMFLMSIFRPCMPPIITSGILNCKNWKDRGTLGIGYTLIVALFECYTWWVSVSVVCLAYMGAIQYPAEVAQVWINIAQRYVTSGRDRSLLHYRKVQILIGLVNRTTRKPVMSCYMLGTIIGATIALFVIITSLAILPTPLILLFFNIAIVFFIVIQVIIKSLALPHLKSTRFLEETFRQPVRRISRWARRFLKSCRPVHISLDDWSIVDRKTSLIIWQLCIENLIALLLL